jgi:hypothetical protein
MWDRGLRVGCLPGTHREAKIAQIKSNYHLQSSLLANTVKIS